MTGRQPPLRVTCLAGSLAIVVVALLVCDLLAWEFGLSRWLATAGLCACFCLRAWQRRRDGAGRLADELLYKVRFRAAVERWRS